ncbi:MAG: GNAT family N-acetyltransferase [Oscillospiraceae bacterium]|nr:GNAT family N-acetyltransferase [Oscillospiraceae bacterium]
MRSEIRLADQRDIPDLCDLWRSCFSDSEEYIRFFYRENFSRISVPVYTLNGKPVSMLHLMDAAFADGPDEHPVRFVYAVGTLPACRSNGLMRSLLLSAARSAKENGYGLFLKPAPHLTEYYAVLGFAQDSRFRLIAAEPEPEGRKDVSFAPISAEEYNRLRNAAFSGRPFVKWPDAHVRWCVEENAFCGGRTLSLSLDGSRHFLMGCPEDGVLRVTETDLSPGELHSAASALCSLFGTARLEAFLPEESCREGSNVISSVVFNAPLRRTYANLLLF